MNKSVLALWLVLPSLSLSAAPAKAPLCHSCHGPDGIAVIDGYPNLKGQNEKYLYDSLVAYKNKQRTGTTNATVMQGQAAMLTDDEMKELAAYFSAL
ncbi:c-type cytochrome [Aliagarivorans taiwanensis]|uniref:c-type cytochrome n=1 Tax=Aliagarivorans taiwanensis TaxID=561966 RepID=UPI000418F52B|nr:cytochrome c [Aliagarivorans taiwanensis]